MPRVVSKNLFNFKPAGVIDENVLRAEEQTMGTQEGRKGYEVFFKCFEMAKDHDDNNKHSKEANEEFINLFRPILDGTIAAMIALILHHEIS